MGYIVISSFKDLEDNEYLYKVGDMYPHNGKDIKEISEERIDELKTNKNKKGIPLIKLIEIEEKPEEKTEEEDTSEIEEKPEEKTEEEDISETEEEPEDKTEEEDTSEVKTPNKNTKNRK